MIRTKIPWVVAAAALIAACARPAIQVEATENPAIKYEVLFTREGCEVGRFIDYGRPVYVTICPAAGVSASQSSRVESCGKNCYAVIDVHQTQVRGDRPSGVGVAGR